ncbi:MAG: PilN domain-containing protein [Thermodesulfobacterium sp.]|nr:PilN domain-containing protein [Thermodesulfobacterium sp.]
MLVCYLTKDEAKFYQIKGDKISEISPASFKLTKYLQKRVLVISRELLFYTRRSYPPIPLKKLKDALKVEVQDFFPLPKVSYTFKIFEATEKFTLVDIWAWSKDEEARVEKTFPFQYVIPEDLLLVDEDTALKIYKQRNIYHLIAYVKGRFLGSLSVAELTQKDVELFLTGLMPYSQDIKKIIIYGDILKDFSPDKTILRYLEKPYPLSLEGLSKINLKEFKVRRALPIKIDPLLRLPVYLFLGYGVYLYATLQNYEKAIKDLKKEISKLDRELAYFENRTAPAKDYSALISALNNKTSQAVSGLTVLNELAKTLPIGCTVNRIVLNEKKLELALTFEDPVEVIELLERSNMVKSVKLEGPPIKKTGTKLYDFRLTVELKPYD